MAIKNRQTILFIYDMEPEMVPLWKDGLWAALQILRKDFSVVMVNLQEKPGFDSLATTNGSKIFALAWGAFGSRPEQFLFGRPNQFYAARGLCLAGYSLPSLGLTNNYDVVFYENNWALEWLKSPQVSRVFKNEPALVHAFGVNTNIFKPDDALKYGANAPVLDYLSVGSFSYWKRHQNLIQKKGVRLAVGQVQKNNLVESVDIMGQLMLNGVGVMDSIEPCKLQALYNLANVVYIGAELMGGGERAVLEARACGRNVEIEKDNLKLAELLHSPIWDEEYYAYSLREAITSAIL